MKATLTGVYIPPVAGYVHLQLHFANPGASGQSYFTRLFSGADVEFRIPASELAAMLDHPTEMYVRETSDPEYSKYNTAINGVKIGEFTFVAPIYGITLNPAGDYTFPAAVLNYGAQTPFSFAVSNNGTGDAGTLDLSLDGANWDAFTLSKTHVTVKEGQDDSFTVAPKTGLPLGTYNAIVRLRSSPLSLTFSSFRISFEVKAPTPTPKLTPTPKPKQASLEPITAVFDKTAPAEVAATLKIGSYKFRKITCDGVDLLANEQYTASTGLYVFNQDWLAGLPLGSHSIVFVMNGGKSPALALTVQDSTPPIADPPLEPAAPEDYTVELEWDEPEDVPLAAPVDAPPPGNNRSFPWWLIVIGVLLLCGIGAGLYVWKKKGRANKA